MVDSKIVKVIGNLDVPIKQKADGTLYTFDPAVSPAEGTTTANGLATTVIDTTRTEPNDHWNNMALLITSGAQNGQVREITDWDLGTGTFTVAPAFGGPILTGVTYKVLTNLPADIDVAAIEAKLDDPATGLAAIKAEVTAVEGKLDARLDATISSRATPAQVEGLVENAVDSGNLTHDITTVNDLLETQMVEIAKTGIYALSIFIDLDVLETAQEGGLIKIRLYNKIDGANYSDKPSAYIEYLLGDDEYPSIEINLVHGNCKLTIQCGSDVTVTRTIAYRYIVRDLGT